MTIIFDTETTGKADFTKPPEHECQPRLVQLGALLLDEELETVGEMNFIIKPFPGLVYELGAVEKHGITYEYALKHGVTELLVLNLFVEWLGMAKRIVAHNIKFDGIILGRALNVYGLEVKPPEPYCTMQSSTNVCKLPGRGGEYKWPTLQEAHQILLGTGFEGAHDAMADVRACARIYEHLIHGDRPKARPPEAPPQRPIPQEQTPDTEYDDDTKMPFGKYKGTPLGCLPKDYCNWLYDQDNLSDKKLQRWLHGK